MKKYLFKNVLWSLVLFSSLFCMKKRPHYSLYEQNKRNEKYKQATLRIKSSNNKYYFWINNLDKMIKIYDKDKHLVHIENFSYPIHYWILSDNKQYLSLCFSNNESITMDLEAPCILRPKAKSYQPIKPATELLHFVPLNFFYSYKSHPICHSQNGMRPSPKNILQALSPH